MPPKPCFEVTIEYHQVGCMVWFWRENNNLHHYFCEPAKLARLVSVMATTGYRITSIRVSISQNYTTLEYRKD